MNEVLDFDKKKAPGTSVCKQCQVDKAWDRRSSVPGNELGRGHSGVPIIFSLEMVVNTAYRIDREM